MGSGYGMLRGRQGAAGFVRETAGARRVTALGLTPGADTALWRLDEEKACPCNRGTADQAGKWEAETAAAGTLFVTAAGRVLLWEEGESAEETYLRCCNTLKKATEKRPVPQTPPVTEKAASVPDPPPVISLEEPPADEPETVLRVPKNTPPVDGLPALLWPRGTEEIRPFFEMLPPFAPFYAPGWRFVRAPSPLPGTAYCALGRYIRNGRVERIAYALPGSPYRPPAELPGYRYRQGYWVLEQPIA